MSYWPPPPTLPSPEATTTAAASPSTLSPKHEHEYEHEHTQQQQQSEQYRSPPPPQSHPQPYNSSNSSSHTRLYEGSLFPHAEPPPPLPLPQSHHHHHHGHDAMSFEWQSRQYAAPIDPRMMAVPANLDPLPIEDSSCSELQRSSVSLEDEIFEARMLQEALQDCDAMPAAMVHSSYHDAGDEVKLSEPATEHYHYHNERHHIHDQHQHHVSSSSSLFQPQSFQAQLLHPSAFATPTNAVLPRGALTQRDSGIHVVSPVETLRSYMLTSNSSQPMLSTSPSSYSSSSSSRSPIMGLARFPGTTPPPGTTASQAQPKKRVQQARICHIEGCTRGIRSRGLCKAHGGGRRCTTPGCTTSDQGGGHCVLHGGGRRCRIDGCMKSAQWRGVCKLHGGARRCRFGNCTKNGQVKQGYCRLHYNALMQQRQQQTQLSLQAQGREGGLKLEHDSAEAKFSVMDPSQQQQQFP